MPAAEAYAMLASYTDDAADAIIAAISMPCRYMIFRRFYYAAIYAAIFAP